MVLNKLGRSDTVNNGNGRGKAQRKHWTDQFASLSALVHSILLVSILPCLRSFIPPRARLPFLSYRCFPCPPFSFAFLRSPFWMCSVYFRSSARDCNFYYPINISTVDGDRFLGHNCDNRLPFPDDKTPIALGSRACTRNVRKMCLHIVWNIFWHTFMAELR